MRKRGDLSRHTHALGKIVRLSEPDEALRAEWQVNLRLLRALLYTSALGTKRQRMKLLEIAHNCEVVSALCGTHSVRRKKFGKKRLSRAGLRCCMQRAQRHRCEKPTATTPC